MIDGASAPISSRCQPDALDASHDELTSCGAQRNARASAKGGAMFSARSRAGLLVLCVLHAASANAQFVTSFLEPDEGRDPITSALSQATQSIDIYVFPLTLSGDDPIVRALSAAAAAGVAVRAVLEPCPGEGASCTPPDLEAVTACQILTQAGALVKWANPAFIKTHAKSTLIDG